MTADGQDDNAVSEQEIAQIVERWVDLVWTEGLDATLGGFRSPFRREEDKQAILAVRAAFPDVQASLTQHLATMTLESNRAGKEIWSVMALVTLRGTHQGEFMGIAPTGKAVQWTRIDVLELGVGRDDYAPDFVTLQNGSNWDFLGLLQQLGGLPTVLPTRT